MCVLCLLVTDNRSKKNNNEPKRQECNVFALNVSLYLLQCKRGLRNGKHMFVAVVSAITNVLNCAQHLAHTGNAQNSNTHTSYWTLVMPINNLFVCVCVCSYIIGR